MISLCSRRGSFCWRRQPMVRRYQMAPTGIYRREAAPLSYVNTRSGPGSSTYADYVDILKSYCSSIRWRRGLSEPLKPSTVQFRGCGATSEARGVSPLCAFWPIFNTMLYKNICNFSQSAVGRRNYHKSSRSLLVRIIHVTTSVRYFLEPLLVA
jgi:hypothetical protein